MVTAIVDGCQREMWVINKLVCATDTFLDETCLFCVMEKCKATFALMVYSMIPKHACNKKKDNKKEERQ